MLYHRKIFVLSSCKDLLAFYIFKIFRHFLNWKPFPTSVKDFCNLPSKKKGLTDYENFKKSID